MKTAAAKTGHELADLVLVLAPSAIGELLRERDALLVKAQCGGTLRMKWKNRTRVERPEYPKMVPVTGSAEQARELLSSLAAHDPDAEIVDGGGRGMYVRVHNEAAETAAKLHGESRSFPLA